MAAEQATRNGGGSQRRRRWLRVGVAVLLMTLLVAGGGFAYMTALGRQLRREYAEREYGNSANPTVVRDVEMAHHVMLAYQDFERAENLLREAYAAEPANRAVAMNYAKVLVKRGKDAEARPILEGVAASDDYHGRVARRLLDPAGAALFRDRYMRFSTQKAANAPPR